MLYKNILLIDDDRDDAEIFMQAADRLNKGVALRWYQNPELALEDLKCADNLPDLIFLDYNMPKINGLEMLEELKSEKKLKDIPVILISTPSQEFMRELLEKKKIIQYISKPNSFNDLIEVLGTVL